MGKIIYHLKPISTYRPMPRKPRRCLSTSTVLCDGWESSGWALSPLRLQTELLNLRTHLNALSPSLIQLSNPRAWNLLPCLSDKSLAAFISILLRPSLTTSEVVSISQRANVPTPLNVMAIGTSFDGCSQYIVAVQIGIYANSRLFYGRIKSHDTVSADVKPCPFCPTLLPSRGMLELTSRVRACLAWLATKECALFAIHCLKDLRLADGVGPTATASNGDVAAKSCP